MSLQSLSHKSPLALTTIYGDLNNDGENEKVEVFETCDGEGEVQLSNKTKVNYNLEKEISI